MDRRKALAEKLKHSAGVKALVGFDGFVDEIVHVVDVRQDHREYRRIEEMEQYVQRLKNGCGLSTNLEIVTIAKKLGGNGPIFANALKKQGVSITYIGSVGEEQVNPIFSELAEGSRMIGLSDPAATDAYEFRDGKIITSKLSPFMKVSWGQIIEKVGLTGFCDLVDEAGLIGMENWTMLPHMSDIWKNVLSDVVPMMKTPVESKTMFFDLADPEKRKKEDIKDALALLERFAKAGFRTVLGLNKKEACQIAELFGAEIGEYAEYPLVPLMEFLQENIRVDCIVVHPVDCACCFVSGQYYCVEGPYCANPVLTTGAGDNFNAGFMRGFMNGFSAEECLLCGVYTSGFYVRRGRSPQTAELADFLETWEGRV